MWNKIFNISAWVVGVAGTFVLFAAAVSTSKQARLKDVGVKIDYAGENFFLDENDVLNTIKNLGFTTENTLMDTINPGSIERVLENHPFIEDAEVYKRLNSKLFVEVQMRKPVLRVFNTKGQSLYLDEHGVFMPLSDRYAARTPVANGWIKLPFDNLEGSNIHTLNEDSENKEMAKIYELFKLVTHVRNDAFWSAQFNQYYVSRSGELEIIPRVGDHVIQIGDTKDLDKKLTKLMKFYQEGLAKTGWNEYKTINLKYANQVVCTKS